MCKAFSCLITKSKKVYWKTGVDSHDELQAMFVKKDKELKDDKDAPKNTFARIEIVPHDGNYLNPKKEWDYQIDEKVKPEWLSKVYEKPCRAAFKKWQKAIYSHINLKEARNPIHPFKIKPPKKITVKHLKILDHYIRVRDTVRATVGDTVRATVGDTVGATVRDTVWATVRATVGDTVRATVWAYYGSLFKGIKKWKYVDYKVAGRGYPFRSAVKLWKMGLVASFDGEKWRLHGGKDAKILWEGTVKDLKKVR